MSVITQHQKLRSDLQKGTEIMVCTLEYFTSVLNWVEQCHFSCCLHSHLYIMAWVVEIDFLFSKGPLITHFSFDVNCDYILIGKC